MSISFNEVPANVRVPGVYIEIDNSLANNAEELQRVLIIGTSSGGDTANNIVTLTATPDTAATRFGTDSQLHKMVTSFYEQNISLPIYCVAVSGTDIASALAATGDQQYHHIVSALNTTTALLTLSDFLKARYHALQQIPGLAYVAKKGTHASLVTLGNAINSAFVNIMPVNTLVTSSQSVIPDEELAAAWAGQISNSLAIDPARPLKTLQLNGVYTGANIEWGYSERNLLLYSGISTYTTNDSNQVYIERPITTYKQNPSGAVDDSYLDITVPATAMYFRAKQRNRILTKFPRHKLAQDGTKFAPGQAVATPSIIKGELLALYKELEYKAICQDFEGYQETLIVQLDADNPSRINIQDSPMFVNGMMIYAGKVQFRK